MIVKLSPRSFKCAATSVGPIPVTLYAPGNIVPLKLLLLLFDMVLCFDGDEVVTNDDDEDDDAAAACASSTFLALAAVAFVLRSVLAFFVGDGDDSIDVTKSLALVAIVSFKCFGLRPGFFCPVLFKYFVVSFSPVFKARLFFKVTRLARRRQIFFSLFGTMAHMDDRRRDACEKSIFGFDFNISWRTSLDLKQKRN